MSSLTLPTLPKSPGELATKIGESICTGKSPIVDNSVIALRFVGRNTMTRDWLSDLGATQPSNIRSSVFTIKVRAGMPYPDSVTWRCVTWRDESQDPRSELEASALAKLEGCVYAATYNLGRTSKDLPADIVTNDRSNAPGAVCQDIVLVDPSMLVPATLRELNQSERLLLRIFIGVASGTDHDEEYAIESYNAIMDWIRPADRYLRAVLAGIPCRHIIP